MGEAAWQIVTFFSSFKIMDKLIEKRHNERIMHGAPVFLESLTNEVNKNCRMVNFSENGLYFRSDEILLPGSEVFIRIEDHPNGSYSCHHVKIKWGKRNKRSRYVYGYGAQYVKPYDQEDSSEPDSDQVKKLRKHPRQYYNKPASLIIGEKSYDGFINNISRNGCFIENHESFKIGQIIELAIPGTKFDKNNLLAVEVTRLSPIGVGVKYKIIIKKKG